MNPVRDYKSYDVYQRLIIGLVAVYRKTVKHRRERQLSISNGMKQHFFALLLGVFFLAPGVAGAYVTTDQQVFPLGENAALFTVEFRFGLQNDSVHLPVFAKRGLENGANAGMLGYDILADGETPTTLGESAAILLGSAAIQDGMYVVPEGRATRFTLVTVLVFPEDAPETDVALRVTELPFYVGEEKQARHMNNSELKAYTTPEVELNEDGVRSNGTVVVEGE